MIVDDDGAVLNADFGERCRCGSGSGCSARASDSISPDQFDWPLGWNVTVMVGRTSVTSAISIRPASSGK